jgi:hypothetical protein
VPAGTTGPQVAQVLTTRASPGAPPEQAARAADVHSPSCAPRGEAVERGDVEDGVAASTARQAIGIEQVDPAVVGALLAQLAGDAARRIRSPR